MNTQKALENTQLRPGRFTDWARIPFLASSVGGGLLLVGMKLIGIDQLYVTISAVGLIFVYAACVHFVPVLRLREDQLADNCYYLGFIYTLISLSFALWVFAKGGDEADIVSNFGLALGSTIAGVVLRVTINQARKDVLETEADARMELAQSVVRLRVQIDDAVLAIATFHNTTQQIASDAIRTASETAQKSLDDSIRKVGEASSGALTKIDSAFEQFTANATQMNELAAGTVKGLRSLLNRIEKIEAPNDAVLRRLEPAMSAIDEAAAQLRGRLESDSNLLAVAASGSEAVAASVRQLISGFSDLQANTAALGKSIELTVQASTEAANRIKNISTGTEELVGTQARANQETRQNLEKTAQSIESSLMSLRQSFDKHNAALAAELERVQRMTAATGEAFADLSSVLSDKITAQIATPFVKLP